MLVVVGLLGILATIAIPKVISFSDEGEQEAKDTEHANLQTAVLALMMAAERDQLDGSYVAVDTEAEVQEVTAGTENLIITSLDCHIRYTRPTTLIKTAGYP